MFGLRIFYGCLLLVATFISSHGFALELMSDEDLSAQSGQSLFTGGYTKSNGYEFFKMGVDASIELNVNIDKVRLGCDGVAGTGLCDISLDKLSLSGLPNDPACAGGRAGCDAVLTRPYLEFAIKGNSLATREISGIRLSAETLRGLLTVGTNDGTQNGINSLSGHAEIAALTGQTQTASGVFTDQLTGRITVPLCLFGCPHAFNTDNKPLNIPSLPISFNVPAFTADGRRMNSLAINANTIIPDIFINAASGSRTANVPGCIGIIIIPICNAKLSTVYFDTKITNLKADIALTEGLGFLHSLPLNNPFSISVQKESIQWPGLALPAQQGWWLAISDPIDLGTLATPAGYTVDISSVFNQVATRASQYLYDNPVSVPLGSAIAGILGIPVTLNVPPVDLSASAPILVNLLNLPLGVAQDVSPNCWGGRTFC